MADTIKDYLVGFGFDVDDSGAGQIESMLKELDGIVRNLATVLTQATDKVQGFVSNIQQQTQAANQSADKVNQLARNTNRFSSEAQSGSRSAGFFSNMLTALGNNASHTGGSLEGAANATKKAGDSASKATPAIQGMSDALSKLMKGVKLIASAAVVKKFLSIGKSLYQYDQSLEQTAKSLSKTKEEARAHTKALEAMGKTYEEIQKDEKLKATYDELTALGESMALPEAAEGADNVRDMVVSFEKLKMVGAYAMQWLYHAVQEVAAGPLARFRETIDKITGNLKLNLPKLSVAGAHIIDGILRIVSAFAKGAVAILEFLDKIPGPVKIIIGLIAAAAYLINSGPFGWMVLLLTGIGALLDDFFGYMEGEDALLGPFWDTCIEVFGNIKTAISNATDTIKGFFEASKGEDGKVNWVGFGGKLGRWILNGIRRVFIDFGTTLKGWITGDENASWDDVAEAVATKIGEAFKSLGEKASNLTTYFIEGIGGLFTGEEGAQFADTLGGMASALIRGIGAALSGATDVAGDILDGITTLLENALAEGKISEILGNLSGLGTQIITAIGKGIKQAGASAGELIRSVGELIASVLKPVTNEDGTTESLVGDLSNFGSAIFDAICQGLKDAIDGGADIISGLFDALTTMFTEDNISNAAESIKTFISNIFKSIGDTIKHLTEKVEDIDATDVGLQAGSIVTNLLKNIFGSVADLSQDSNVTSFVEKLGKGLVSALGKLGEIVGSIAGKIVGWVFSGDAIKAIFNAGKGIIGLLIKGLEFGISGVTNLTFGLLDGILEALGIVDTEAKEKVKARFKENQIIKEALGEGLAEAIDEIDWDDYKNNNGSVDSEKLNQVILDALFGGYGSIDDDNIKKDFIEGIQGNLAQIYADSLGLTDEARENAIREFSGRSVDDNDDFEYLEQFFNDYIQGIWDSMSEAARDGEFSAEDAQEIIRPFIESLGGSIDLLNDEAWEAMATYVREGSDESHENLMNLIFSQIVEQALSGNGEIEGTEELSQQAFDAARDIGIEVAEAEQEGFNEGYNSEDKEVTLSGPSVKGSADADVVLESVDVIPGDGTQLEDATQETIDTIIGEHTFSADVTVKTNVTVEVEDSNAETIGTEIGTGIGQHMSTALSTSNPLSGMLDSFSESLDELLSKVDAIVKRIKTKFSSIGNRASSVFNSIASNAKSALQSLPEWIQINVVDKINESFGTIHLPNITPSGTTGGTEPHSSEGRRVDHEMITRVGEGGKREYIIPVTKPSRGIPLLKQAAADLGLTVQSYANATKLLGGSPDRAVTPAHAAAAMTNNSVANHYSTIDAHANINVYGSDPKSTANNVNRSHEQVLLRNVKPLLG